MARSFHILTLGCKINQYETQALREAWLAGGFTETAVPGEAGLLLVNSCAVTARAVRDLRQTLRRLHREVPRARIVVTGCAAGPLQEELRAMDGVALVVPQGHKPLLLEPENALVPHLTPPLEALEASPHFALEISAYQRARAVLKVQDGCSHGCSYCIVPLTRGPARSRPFPAVLREAERLLRGGLRELVLSGVNLRQYRSEGRDFWDLLRDLDRELAPEWAGRARLRLSSLEPSQLTARGVDVLAGTRMLCPHVHLSLQSGSPSVLARMGRGHYGPRDVLGGVERLRQNFPLLGLGADLLVGFPGESEEESADTRGLVEELPLTYAHVFPYSKRPGTKAAALPGQVEHHLKTRRAAALRELVARKRQAFLETLRDLPMLEVLVETLEEGEDGPAARGRCQHYVPVELQGPLPESALRRLVLARPCGIRKGRLTTVYEAENNARRGEST